jgi:WD40 repeat protein
VWRAKDRQDVAVLHGHLGAVVDVAFAADRLSLASLSCEPQSGSVDNSVRVWEVDPGATLPVLRGHKSYVYPVAFSPDGRWIASGSWDKDNPLRLWDAATGEPCAPLPHPGVVPSLAYGPDGTWLASGTHADKWLRIWDVATARVRKRIPGPAGVIRFVTVSPDGKRMAVVAWDDPQYILHVYDMASGERLFRAECGQDPYPSGPAAYSSDGRWLAIRSADGLTVLLLDARTFETGARFSGHDRPVLKLLFSPDSRLLASCSADHTVRLWPIAGGDCRVLRGHTDIVYAAAFHKGGTRLATAGRDQAVWLWDLSRGEAVARLPGHASYIHSLAFSPDGATLVSGSGDFTLRLWDTTPLKTRYQARREAAALRPEAERLVERLWREKNDPAAVVEALRANGALSEPLRHAALREVLRRAQPPTDVPGKPHDPP